MKNIYFSIIIPTFNEDDNIKTLLTSIKNQTYKDFEVLISDSKSEDNTLKAINNFKGKIENLHVSEKKFRNVSAARNYGALHAKGEFLIFFDADTKIENNFLKEIKEKIEKYNLDDLTVWNRPKEKSIVGSIILTIMNLGMTISQKINPAANGPCIIMKKKMFESIRGFDQRIVFGEDFHLIQKAHKKHAKFAVFRTPLFYVSARRFEKEGLFVSLYKSIKAIFHQQFLGPIRKEIFEYEMGGQYYEDEK